MVDFVTRVLPLRFLIVEACRGGEEEGQSRKRRRKKRGERAADTVRKAVSEMHTGITCASSGKDVVNRRSRLATKGNEETRKKRRTESNTRKSRRKQHLTLRLFVASIRCDSRKELDGLTEGPFGEDVGDGVATLEAEASVGEGRGEGTRKRIRRGRETYLVGGTEEGVLRARLPSRQKRKALVNSSSQRRQKGRERKRTSQCKESPSSSPTHGTAHPNHSRRVLHEGKNRC